MLLTMHKPICYYQGVFISSANKEKVHTGMKKDKGTFLDLTSRV